MGGRPGSLSDGHHYPRRRRRKRYVIKWGRLITCLLLAALAVEVVIAGLASPYFAVRKVEVTGNATVPTSEILHRLNLRNGSSIFRIRKRAMVNRLKGDPAVEDARIFRRLPDGLSVHVIERQADLVLKVNGRLYELDASGVPFRVVKRAKPGLTVISCKVPGRIRPDRRITAYQFRVARECLVIIRARKMFRVAEISVDQNNDLCLNTRDGFQVILGRPEQLSRKLGDATRVVREVPGFRQHGEYVNVSCPGNPACKLKE